MRRKNKIFMTLVLLPFFISLTTNTSVVDAQELTPIGIHILNGEAPTPGPTPPSPIILKNEVKGIDGGYLPQTGTERALTFLFTGYAFLILAIIIYYIKKRRNA